MEKKSRWPRILGFIGASVFVALFIFQIVNAGVNRVVTETVVEANAPVIIAAKIFVVRDERVIGDKGVGTVVPIIEDGKRVAKGDIVAAVCTNWNDAQVYTETAELRNVILRYDLLNKQKNINALDIAKLKREADSLFVKILSVADSGEVGNVQATAEAFRNKLTDRQIAIDGHIDLSKKLDSYKKRLAEISGISISVENLVAEEAGYYINRVDGYEGSFDYYSIDNISSFEIEQKMNSEPVKNERSVIGKLVCNYSWYFLSSIKTSESVKLKVGQQVNILYGQAFENNVDVKVRSIKDSLDGKAAVVFETNLMNEQLADIRIEDAKIVLKERKGLKINSAAVRVVNGETGAFVRIGNIASFRKFKILVSGEDYVIASIVQNLDGAEKPFNIELFDEAIVKGKDIYDRKVIS